MEFLPRHGSPNWVGQFATDPRQQDHCSRSRLPQCTAHCGLRYVEFINPRLLVVGGKGSTLQLQRSHLRIPLKGTFLMLSLSLLVGIKSLYFVDGGAPQILITRNTMDFT